MRTKIVLIITHLAVLCLGLFLARSNAPKNDSAPINVQTNSRLSEALKNVPDPKSAGDEDTQPFPENSPLFLRWETLSKISSFEGLADRLEDRLLRGQDASFELAFLAETAAKSDPTAFIDYALTEGVIGREHMDMFLDNFLRIHNGDWNKLVELNGFSRLASNEELMIGVCQSLSVNGIDPASVFDSDSLSEGVLEKSSAFAQMEKEGFESALLSGAKLNTGDSTMVQLSDSTVALLSYAQRFPSSFLKSKLSETSEQSASKRYERDKLAAALIERDPWGALDWFVDEGHGIEAVTAMNGLSQVDLEKSLEYLRTADTDDVDVIVNLVLGVMEGAGKADSQIRDECSDILTELGIRH